MRGPLIATLLVSACGDSPRADGAGPDASAPFAIDPPAPPAEPQKPSMAPCPAGWIERDLGYGIVCDPFDGAFPTCRDDEIALPGVGCAPIGPECTGEYAADLPASGVVYVAPMGTGDGSRARPLGSIDGALAERPAHIALARGEHRGPLVIEHPVHIHGACAGETRIVSSFATQPAIVVEATATLENVTVTSERSQGIKVQHGSELTLRSVIVDRATGTGISASSASTLRAHRIRVRGMSTTSGIPLGLRCGTDSRCEIDESMFGPDSGVLAMEGETLVVRACSALVPDDALFFVTGERGGTTELSEIAAPAARFALNGTSRVRASEVMTGAFVTEGGTLMLERAWLRSATGIAASLEGVRGTLRDVIITDPVPNEFEGVVYAGGIAITRAALGFDRIAIAGATGSPFVVVNDATAVGQDLTIVAGADGARAADGALLVNGAAIDLRRARIEGFERAGLALGVPFRPDGRHNVLRDVTLDGSGGVDTFGIQLAGAQLELERVVVRNVIHEGLFVDTGGTLAAIDLAVEDAETTPRRGLEVRGGGSVRLERARFERAREHSLLVVDETARIDGTQVSILESRPRECDGAPACDSGFGIGLGVFFRGEAILDGFEIDGSAQCGVHLLYGGTIALRNGRLRDHPIAICAEHNAIDLAAVSDGVVYEDNRTMLDGVSLPVPAPEAR